MKLYTFDQKTGRVEETTDFVKAFESDRSVAETRLGAGSSRTRVSTVFLALDHRYSGDGPPILFETMVFGGPCDGLQERYCTLQEAQEGHEAMVEHVRKTLKEKQS